jgi:hypothetical protein
MARLAAEGPMGAIVEKSAHIAKILVRQRARHAGRETGGSYNEACGLARLQHERRLLQRQLPPLRLVRS